MSDKPILFSGPMVRALLAGTKTQTRREIARPGLMVAPYNMRFTGCGVPMSIDDWGATHYKPLRIAAGDRLYVRESLAIKSNDQDVRWLGYAADGKDVWPLTQWTRGTKGVPSIHAPRWTSRITLTVTDVRVERLQTISELDVMAEGIVQHGMHFGLEGSGWYNPPTSAASAYRQLWETINGAKSWEANPWVAAYSFTVAMANIDSIGAT